MAMFLQQKGEDYQWGIWKLEESVEELLYLLPPESPYREEIFRFKSPRRQQEWLAARILLGQMLGEEKEIRYESTGKPYLADGSFSISISHTKGYVAVILGNSGAVGIDIEQYGKRVEGVAHRFLREDEKPQAYRGELTWALLLHWSAKETLFKYIEGADADFRKLRIFPFSLQEQGCFEGQDMSRPQQPLHIVSYLLSSEFVLTWVS